jgi:RNA polymerase sigma-70 factor (ECF subfamily)
MRSRRFAFWRRLLPADRPDTRDASARWADPGPSPERTLLAREEVNALWVALEGLPARQRTVFLLRFVEEMSLAEIGAVLGLSIGSVKVHLHRATGNLRARLGRA